MLPMPTTVEPGLLRLFRWYVVIRWVFLVLVLIGVRGDNPPDPPQFPTPGLVLFGALLLLLVWPFAQRRLGRAFLPIAIALATIAPIVDSAATIAGRLDLGFSPNEALGDYWLAFFLLFVPFILTAWQYRYRWVLVFAVVSTVLDMVFVGTLLEPTNADLSIIGALLFARGALFAFLGLFVTKLVAGQREAREILQNQAVTMEQLATVRERNRLARELHDTLAHTMTATAVQLEAIKALWETEPDRARELLDSALGMTRSGLAEARRAIEALRASPIEEHGLTGALERLAADVAATSEVEIEAVVEPVGDLPPDLEHATYRIADEAVNNALRHGDPARVTITMSREAQQLRLLVSDDGSGFDMGSVENGHHGITGMRERAVLVRGTLDVESFDGRGTKVIFNAPIIGT